MKLSIKVGRLITKSLDIQGADFELVVEGLVSRAAVTVLNRYQLLWPQPEAIIHSSPPL